jgi:hypothetical protein
VIGSAPSKYSFWTSITNKARVIVFAFQDVGVNRIWYFGCRSEDVASVLSERGTRVLTVAGVARLRWITGLTEF